VFKGIIFQEYTNEFIIMMSRKKGLNLLLMLWTLSVTISEKFAGNVL